jgi:hypothetical protein
MTAPTIEAIAEALGDALGAGPWIESQRIDGGPPVRRRENGRGDVVVLAPMIGGEVHLDCWHPAGHLFVAQRPARHGWWDLVGFNHSYTWLHPNPADWTALARADAALGGAIRNLAMHHPAVLTALNGAGAREAVAV